MRATYAQALEAVAAVDEYNRRLRAARSELFRRLAEAGVKNLASRFPKHEAIEAPFKPDFLERLKSEAG